MTPTQEAAAANQDLEAFCERVHQMGHAVDRKRIPFFETRDWEAEDVMDVWAGKYARNIAMHYPDILASGHIGVLKDVAAGAPVAVVGAGPSLDDNGAHLADFPGLVVATDRAAKHLTARGLPVDLVVTVDPRQAVIAEMLDYPEAARQALVLSVYSAPDVAAAWRGKKLYASTIHPGTQFHDRILPELFPGMPGLYATGNVGNTAVQVAAWLGAGPVVLVGQDYGYTGGRRHCQDYTHLPNCHDGTKPCWQAVPVDPEAEVEALSRRTGKLQVEGVWTYNAFVGYRDSLTQIAEANKLDVVNATEGGIITQFPRRPLRAMANTLRIKYPTAHIEARARLAQALGGIP